MGFCRVEDEPNKEYEGEDCEEECGQVEEELLVEVVGVEYCLLVCAVFGGFLIDLRHLCKEEWRSFAVLRKGREVDACGGVK